MSQWFKRGVMQIRLGPDQCMENKDDMQKAAAQCMGDIRDLAVIGLIEGVAGAPIPFNALMALLAGISFAKLIK